MSWRGELELENGRLDDHGEQVEQVDEERVRGCGGCSEIPKNRSDHFFGI